MRIATWNVCWFSELFDRHDNLLLDGEWSKVYNVTRKEQAEAIARVLRTIDADLVLIIEAPNTGKSQSTSRALSRFADTFDLRQSHALIGFESETHQEIAALYDPDSVAIEHDPQGGMVGHAPRFDQRFELDTDVDSAAETHVFSKPPLELAAETALGPLRLIGVHAKSKAPRGARTEAEAQTISISNRRKQLAQCIWLRQRVDTHLRAGEDLIVLGDFNDGPGLDTFEKLFGRSGVEVVLGGDGQEQLVEPFTGRWREGLRGATAATARFYDREAKRYVNTLIDFIMLSPALAARTAPVWRIWHPFDDPECFDTPALQKALLQASDHFPVTVDLLPTP
ncbi:endonuclease/exonuclease/phosphatase family protein [Algicella marina]|uniref:Endonuclease n=1 Tax=Algicella marina TaxID=2683284 RepID=A0A6P1T088_9RHOB|nr:endonuclease/exonuclease/phosphatase family protein [Algicella marina]QHQ33912.1 endonuclease [Algicella marina]